ncbi:MAG: glycosyltransferase family 39 protein [Candidatus Omnitrophota bacterium]|nr:glycosyltransferase family 39 protein [Candidatus Omnitrophota bacterium]MBU1894789.1 glycosyltransferase family 39 protein [Candidatus Omnitrophota bacterium]
MRKEKYFITILLVISVFLFFFGLGSMSLTDPDETFYAQTAKEMFNANEWNTPLLFGNPQFEKPILYYWLIMLSYIVFGIGEFAARFPSAVFGVIGIFGVYFLGRSLFSPLCGFLSGLVLATSVQYLVLAKACVTDMVLTVFILLCMLFFLLGWTKEKKIYYYISAIMAGFATLTKGPIGLFIPGVVFLTYIAITSQWGRVKKIPIIRCVLLALLVSVPWYILAIKLHGELFLNEFFGLHNITRFLKPEHKIGMSPFFYIPIVLGGIFPWTFFMIFGTWDMVKEKSSSSGIKGKHAFLLIWFLVVFIFFSVSRTKLVTYILPLFPAIAIITGRFLEKFIINKGADNKIAKQANISMILLMISATAASIGIALFISHKYPQLLNGIIAADIIFIVCLLITAIVFYRGKKMLSIVLLACSVFFLSVQVVNNILPIVGDMESSSALSYKINELAKPEEPVGGECDHRRGIAFYTNRTDIVDVHSYSRLMSFFSRKEKVWGIIQFKHYKQLKKDKGPAVSDPLFRVGKYVLITNL